ncbi:hypothetical protein CRUP_036838 [Coryphaenoides rupestris]|nr:hypothetical protein CRUP_036838 [Coryphaenoides rupestris]
MHCGALQIELSEESDQGKYECVATNSDGTRYSTPANLYVRVRRVPPRFSIPPADSEIMPGGSVNITCVAVGSPMPYVNLAQGSRDPHGDREDGHQHYPHLGLRVGGLSPYSHYDFRVAAINTIGKGPSSDVVEARTAEQAPSSPPRQVRGRMLSTTTAIIHWDEPEEANGQVVGYRVYYTSDSALPVNQWEKQMVRSANFITIQSLTPNKTYYIRVLAFTSVGDGPLSQDLQIIAKTGVPSQPSNFRIEAKSETSVLLSWVAPPQSGPDNQITGYELVYRHTDHPEEKASFEPTTSYLLKNLKPFSTYTFQLAARSKHGVGAYTNEVSIDTPQTLPSAPPQEVVCTSRGSTSVLVSWAPPPEEFHNGLITGYTIQYAPTEGAAGGNRTSARVERVLPPAYLLEDLRKWTEYGITVRAVTEAGEGPESLQLLVRTEEDVPSGAPRGVEGEALNATAVRVKWRVPPPELQHGQIRGYQVHYVRLEHGEPQGQPSVKDILMEDSQRKYTLECIAPAITVCCSPSKQAQHQANMCKMELCYLIVPDKPTLAVSYSEAATALLEWHPTPDPPTPLLGYRLTLGRADVLPFTVVEFPAKDRRYTAQDVHKGARYVFRLSARNKMGYGAEAVQELTTPEDRPSGCPEGVVAQEHTASSVRLAWKSVPLVEQNGRILKYSVLYKDVNGRGNASEAVAAATTPGAGVLLRGLSADTVYDVRVRAFTAVGPGPYSPAVQFRTQQLGQVFATNFRVKAAMKNSVLLSWEVRDKNPTPPFTILYGKGQSVEVDGKETQKLITGLEPNTQYSFLLTNRANSAGGLQHRVTATTAPDILKTKPTLVGKANADVVTVQLPTVETAAKVRGYYVVVLPLTRQRGGKFLNPWEEPDQMNMDELLKEINRTSVSRGRQATQSEPRAYVTAHFKNLPLEFTLGDGRNYGDFHNRPLLNGQEYVFFVLAVLDLSENTMFSTSPYSDPVTSSVADPQPIVDEEEGLLWVVGPVLAVIFIVCIVIAILLFKRKRAEAEGRKGSFPCSKAMSSHHPTDPVELRRINFQTPGRVEVKRAEAEGRKGSFPCSKAMSSHHPTDPVELRRINFQTPGMASHPPVAISELADHIERLKANDNLKFSQEYESVDPGQQFTWENSNLEPALLRRPEASDYINANYIDGYRRQSAYIATQGSLPETFCDFWRLVWEQHTANIIMMTKLEEKSRVKCDQYWPTRGTETYGLIQVTLLDTVELATYSSGSNEKREVRQFQFTAWPDHGVPEHPTPFLAFLRRVKACNPPDAGPMVVHCSAGVGRTGCFIVIDAMVERIKQEKALDIYGHVTLMRSQRNYMVQTEDQYVFIHDALLEAVTCGNTEVPARNLYSYIQRLTQVEPGESITGMELEFKRLASAKAHTSRFVSANLPCNKFKNRLVNIMPYETTRVCLQPIRGVEGSDYINASFIDGYRSAASTDASL